MRKLTALSLVFAASIAVQAQDGYTATVTVVSESKQSLDKGSTTKTVPAHRSLQDVIQHRYPTETQTKNVTGSYMQVIVTAGDIAYTLNGREGAPGIPFGTWKAKITNGKYMDIMIVRQDGSTYSMGFEIVGADKIETGKAEKNKSEKKE